MLTLTRPLSSAPAQHRRTAGSHTMLCAPDTLANAEAHCSRRCGRTRDATNAVRTTSAISQPACAGIRVRGGHLNFAEGVGSKVGGVEILGGSGGPTEYFWPSKYF